MEKSDVLTALKKRLDLLTSLSDDDIKKELKQMLLSEKEMNEFIDAVKAKRKE